MKTLLAVVVFVVACSPGWNDPIRTTPQPGYPCGYQGVSCGNHMCCSTGEVCGAEHTGCPAGSCCFVGNDQSYGAKRPHPQRPESSSR